MYNLTTTTHRLYVCIWCNCWICPQYDCPLMFFTRNYARAARMISKQGNKDYFKGHGGGKIGRHTKHGKFVIDPERLREFIVPDLSNFQLKPYVSHETMPVDKKTWTVERYIEESLNNNKN